MNATTQSPQPGEEADGANDGGRPVRAATPAADRSRLLDDGPDAEPHIIRGED